MVKAVPLGPRWMAEDFVERHGGVVEAVEMKETNVWAGVFEDGVPEAVEAEGYTIWDTETESWE